MKYGSHHDCKTRFETSPEPGSRSGSTMECVINQAETHINIGPVNRAVCYHGCTTVSTEAVSQYGRHHRVTIRDVLTTALRQSYYHLDIITETQIVDIC